MLIDFRGCAGTPVYMAPELAEENIELVCKQSDIYLLGAILFEILEGFPPHLLKSLATIEDPEQQFAAVIQAVVHNEIEDDVANSGELMQIARKAMATFPHDRFKTVEEFQEAIREYRITGRAEELLHDAVSCNDGNYDAFQQSVALFSDALRKWPSNQRAIRGDRDARAAFAKLALKKGDYDLGMEVVAGHSDQELTRVSGKLRKSRGMRVLMKTTWLALFIAAIVFLGWNVKARQELVAAHGEREILVQEAAQLDEDIARQTQKNKDLVDQFARAEQKLIEDAETQRREVEMKLAADIEEREKQFDKKNAELQAMSVAKQKEMQDEFDRKKAEFEKQKTVLANELANVNASAQKEIAIAKETAQEEIAKVQNEIDIEKLKGQITVSYNLREYRRVLTLCERALAELENNPAFDAKERRAIELKIQAAQQNLGNTQLQLDRPPFQSSISVDGATTVMIYNADNERGRMIEFRTRGTDGESQQQEAFPNGAVSGVFVSPGGSAVCAVGPALRLLWKRNDQGQFEQCPFQDNTTINGGYDQCLYSSDEKHLYLVGKDAAVTVEILDLNTTPAQTLTRSPLFDSSGEFFCQDIALLPDESAILCLPQKVEIYCRAFPIQWTDGQPQISSQRRNAPPLLGMDDSRIRNNSAKSSLKLVTLFPDGSNLLVGVEHVGDNTLIILPRRKNAKPDEFPFLMPSEVDSLSQFACTSEKLPTEIRISDDSQRIAAVLNQKSANIQLWDLLDGQWQKSVETSLDPVTERDGAVLSGHGDRVLALGFVDGTIDHLVSVSLDQTLCHWDLKTYGDFRSQMCDIVKAWSKQDSCEAEDDQVNAVPPRAVPVETSHRNVAATDAQLTFFSGDPILTVFPGSGPTEPSDESNSPITEISQGRNIFSATFSEDGKRVLAGADDLAAHVFQSETGTRTLSMTGRVDLLLGTEEPNYFVEGHNSEITGVRFLPPNGDLLLTSENFGVISVWDAKADEDGIGHERSRLLTRYSASDFAVSADGQWILAGGAEINSDPNVALDSKLLHQGLLWRTEDVTRSLSPDPFLRLRGEHPQYEITAVAISPDATRAVTCGRRGKITVWSIPEGDVIGTTDRAHGGDGISGDFFTSESEFLTSGFDGRVLHWVIGTNGELSQQGVYTGQMIVRMEPAADRTRFTITDITGGATDDSVEVSVLDISGNLLKQLIRQSFTRNDPGLPMRSGCAWSPDGTRLMHVIDGQMTLYNTTSWEVTDRFALDQKNLQPLRGAFAPTDQDGTVRFVTLSGRQAHLWRLPDGEHLAEFRTHHTDRITADFSSDRRFVLTASETLRMFDADEESPTRGKTIFRLRIQDSHAHPLTSARFSPAPNDSRFVSCDQSGEVRIWNWTPGSGPPAAAAIVIPSVDGAVPQWAINNNIQRFASLAEWSQDGQLIAAVRRGQLQCWKIDGEQAAEISIPMPPNAEYRFNDVTFSRTNRLLTAGGIAYTNDDLMVKNTACVWRINEDESVTLIASLLDNEQHSGFSGTENEAGGITAVWLDSEQSVVITGGIDSRLNVWTLDDVATTENGDFEWSIRLENPKTNGPPHTGRISAIEVSSENRIVTADDKGQLVIWKPGSLGK
ncbi:MAG: hypothetical protein KDA85_08875 [Planctomycetaceae bacterium]|nr:hypothetical protein [Planctomycetaceae bacterium]